MLQMRSASVVNLALLTTLTTMAAPWMAAANAFPKFPQPQKVAGGTNVTIKGSSNLNPLNLSLKKGFEKQYSGAKANVSNAPTPAALAAVAAGQADLAAIGRPLTEAEQQQGLVAVPVGRDKIAVVVGEKNPFKRDLTINQFAQLFRGEAKSWQALGGPNNAVRFVDRVNADTRSAFPNYPAFNGKALESGATAVKVEDEKPGAMAAKLGANGVSFLPASLVPAQKGIRVLTMHGVPPTDKRYPFSQPLFYVYKGNPNAAVQAFLGFAGSKVGQSAIAAAGIKQPIDFNQQATSGAVAAAPAVAKASNSDQAKADAAAKAKADADKAAKAKADADQAAKAKTDAAAKAKAAAAAQAKANGADNAAAGKPDAKTPTAAANAPAAGTAGNNAAGQTDGAPGQTTVEPASPGAVANNQVTVEETGRGIPPWLWWLLLPLGLLGLLLWLLPKDEEDDVLPARESSVSGPLRGTGMAVGGAVDSVQDTASQVTDSLSDAAGNVTDATGNAISAGGTAAAGLGAAGAGAAAMARLRGDKSQLDDTDRPHDTEWEPGTGDAPELSIETPDWNLETHESAEVVAEDWLQTAQAKVGDAVDATQSTFGDAKDAAGETLSGAGAAAAGVGAAAAGFGAAAWARLRGQENVAATDENAAVSAEAEWEFEGELPAGGTEPSSRMADFAPDVPQGNGTLFNQAKGAVSQAVDSTKDAATGAVDGVRAGIDGGTTAVTGAFSGATDTLKEGVGASIDQVRATSTNVTDKAGEATATTSGWLKSLFGKAKDVAGDATDAAADVGGQIKDGVGAAGATAAGVGAAAIAGVGAALKSGTGRVVMVPYNSREALVRWEMDEAAKSEVRSLGGTQLVLRLYDVTDMDETTADLPNFEQFDLDEAAQEQRILIPQRDRTYMTVLGYLSRSGGFLEVSRSESVQIPAS